MNCPKCKAKMTDYHGASICGGLNQQESPALISGHTCVMCGKWIEPEPIVVLEFDKSKMQGGTPKPPSLPKNKAAYEQQLAITEDVERLYDQIYKLRAEGVSWRKVKIITQCLGTDTSIKKAYLKILRGQ